MHQMIKTIMIFLFGIIAALTIIELSLRAFNLVQLTDEYLPKDDYLKFKLGPNVDTTIYSADNLPFDLKTVSLIFDDIGFRDDGINDEPYAVAVGDSFTMGLSVNADESWVELLETKLGKDVVNMGVLSYSTVAEERTLEKYGMKLNPKLVIVGFSVNDYSDSYNFFENVSVGKNFLDSLKEKVALYKFLWQRLGELKHDYEVIKYNDENLDFIFWPQPAIDDINPIYEKVKAGEQFTKDSLLRIRKLAETNNATLLIVMLPAKEQVYWHIVSKLVRNPDDYTFDYPMESLNEFCISSNLDCLDLTPVFKEKAKAGEQLFFRVDSHYNELGNKLVAEGIYAYFSQYLAG